MSCEVDGPRGLTGKAPLTVIEGVWEAGSCCLVSGQECCREEKAGPGSGPTTQRVGGAVGRGLGGSGLGWKCSGSRGVTGKG